MNCLILAAGYGSRLRALSDSKPLTPVAGVPLIEHVMRRALAGGASRFTVVTGHLADRVEAFVGALGDRLGVPVRTVRVADWSLANGHSVLAGSATIEGDYLLTMSDHLFDPAIVRALLAAPRADLLLAVDRTLEGPLLDIDDATKVSIAGDGAIVAIGKTISDYNAIDTGLFLATPALAVALRDCIAAGGAGSLSDGVQRLGARGAARTVDVTGMAWIDVDDPRCHALAATLVDGVDDERANV
jgi:1L-myo-inositol 1-phosphate cytidylyltransferase